MENAVYWNGRQVGIECAGRILWFASAPAQAIAAYGAPRQQLTARADTVVARNLAMPRSYDPSTFPARLAPR
ncbi:hypothetical protein OKW42_006756 [Paraburkholderia sp. WC7.3d]|uniref:Uncharacterized protein n=1 Tax=Paraburkholderia podalyriae TaxID=1938811 RepID=A0ABR7PQK0_9BURK|nr:hypothetical protein [Paraburkholderia podalyriae]MBC8748539.1 hypothetical protein [Paraburkholderia podalyriae]